MAYVLFIEDRTEHETKITASDTRVARIFTFPVVDLLRIVRASAESALTKLGFEAGLVEYVHENQWPLAELFDDLPEYVRLQIMNVAVPPQLRGVCCDLEIPLKKQRSQPTVEVGKNLVRLLWHWRSFHASAEDLPPFNLVVCSSFEGHFADVQDFCDRCTAKDSL
jgi:hypothetical protein